MILLVMGQKLNKHRYLNFFQSMVFFQINHGHFLAFFIIQLRI